MNDITPTSQALAKVEESKSELHAALAKFAEAAQQLEPAQRPAAFEVMKSGKALFEEGYASVRDKLVERGLDIGEPAGDKGTRVLREGAFETRVIPTRSGLDPRLVEAMLLRRKLPLKEYMVPTITYTLGEDHRAKLATAIAAGLLTQADVDACKYEVSYRVEVRRARDG